MEEKTIKEVSMIIAIVKVTDFKEDTALFH